MTSMICLLAAIVIFLYLTTFAMMISASDADDAFLGDDQYTPDAEPSTLSIVLRRQLDL